MPLRLAHSYSPPGLSQMFSLLHNIDKSLAPPHSTLCVTMEMDGNACLRVDDTPARESSVIANDKAFQVNLFGSDKGLRPKERAPPKVGGWRMDHAQ